jgi:hypothetical protein
MECSFGDGGTALLVAVASWEVVFVLLLFKAWEGGSGVIGLATAHSSRSARRGWRSRDVASFLRLVGRRRRVPELRPTRFCWTLRKHWSPQGLEYPKHWPSESQYSLDPVTSWFTFVDTVVRREGRLSSSDWLGVVVPYDRWLCACSSFS